MNRLADDQLTAFDTEYVTHERWVPIEAGLADLQTFSFLDIGGGNGVFVDRVLDNFDNASGTVGEYASKLLELNVARPRKRTIALDALALPSAALERVDVVFLNWVLHHLVVTGNYAETRETVVRVLTDLRWLLKNGGKVSVYENMYDGLIYHNAPGRLIFSLTSCRLLAKVIRRLGANTAGVGVCFQSERSWRTIFREAGFEVLSFTPDAPWPMNPLKRAALAIRRVRCGQFWIRPLTS